MDGENHGKPYQNGWFGGTPIFGNTHIVAVRHKCYDFSSQIKLAMTTSKNELDVDFWKTRQGTNSTKPWLHQQKPYIPSKTLSSESNPTKQAYTCFSTPPFKRGVYQRGGVLTGWGVSPSCLLKLCWWTVMHQFSQAQGQVLGNDEMKPRWILRFDLVLYGVIYILIL